MLYFQNHFKNWSKFIRMFSFKITSGSFDETMLFTIVFSAWRRSSLIFLVVELTKQQRGCNSSLSRKQFDAGKRARKDLMRDIKFQKPVAEFALNSINDFKVRCFQIHFHCEFRCVLSGMTSSLNRDETDFFRLFIGRDVISLV